MANETMKETWERESGPGWVRREARYDGMLAPWAALLDEAAAVAPGERVLDVGCGFGTTALDAAARTGPGGAVLGVDLSSAMVARARERAAAAGLAHARFAVADAQTDDVGAGHDVVISRFGIMFFEDPVAAFAHMAEAVRPGGRLTAVVWTSGAEQEWVPGVLGAALAHVPFPDLGAPGAPGPFALADADRTRAILTEAGWSGVTLDRHTRTQFFAGTTSLDEAMEYAETGGPGRALLAGAPDEATRARALAAVREFLASRATPDGFPITGNAWLLAAHRP